MNEAAYISSIRVVVSDYIEPVVYPDLIYQTHLQSAVQSLNQKFGLGYTYSTSAPGDLSSIAGGHSIWVRLYATIQMCYTRAARENVSPTGSGTARTVTVPNLSVTNDTTSDGAKVWLKLAERLQEELDALEETMSEEDDSGYDDAHRAIISTRTGQRTQRDLDSVPPTPVVTATSENYEIEVAWTQWKSQRFFRYDVIAGMEADLSDGQVYHQGYDSQNPECVLIVTGPGTYYVRVKTYNDNRLASSSTIVEVEVE